MYIYIILWYWDQTQGLYILSKYSITELRTQSLNIYFIFDNDTKQFNKEQKNFTLNSIIMSEYL